MLKDDEIVTSVQEESDPVDDKTDEIENNNSESSKSPSNADAFSTTSQCRCSLLVKVTDSWLEFMPSTTKDLPCRGTRCTFSMSRLKRPLISVEVSKGGTSSRVVLVI
ncbi:hypothetical protein TNCV_2109541 [Trichonephila clavipes]|nr:hypothetical protein TNCV_2109541 [Trichonephila clavipes]